MVFGVICSEVGISDERTDTDGVGFFDEAGVVVPWLALKCVPGPVSALGSGELRGSRRYFDAY